MLVLFDIGSTLLEGPPRGPGSRLASAFGLSPVVSDRISDMLFRNTFNSPDHLGESLAREFALPLHKALAEARSLWAAQIEEAYPLPGADEALDRVMAAGHTVAFVSNIWQPFLEAFSRHFRDAHARHRGYYSFQIGISKPDPLIFRSVLTDLGADPAQTVMIGDTYQNDIDPALRLGMKAIWVLQRPDKEKASITQVLNGSKPAPNVALGSIGDLTAEHLERLGKC